MRPEDIGALAAQAGIATIAITDHDTICGIDRAIAARGNSTAEVIPGVELSAVIDETEVHILGYFIDWHEATFTERMGQLRRGRLERAKKILLRLKELGVDLPLESVLEIAGEGVIGRPHIADGLIRGGFVSSYDEAFDRYIGQGAPAYIPKQLLHPAEAIRLISSVGGIPVLAHPGTLKEEGFIRQLILWGLKGIEAVHPVHTQRMIDYYKTLAKTHGLLYTGGSDFHGEGRRFNSIGKQKVPSQVVRDLKSLIQHNNG